MRLLDLFCGAGGAAMGYHWAGFEVVGVDIAPQKNYPFRFIQADALAFVQAHGEEFDVIHASPPCQTYLNLKAANKALGRANEYPDLISAVRTSLRRLDRLYVIENGENAPLIEPLRLCGSSFGLAVRRHRFFESSVFMLVPPCAHYLQNERKYWTGWIKDGKRTNAKVVQVYGNGGERHLWPEAMGIDWMKPSELAQAIPPAYTKYIGSMLMWHLEDAT